MDGITNSNRLDNTTERKLHAAVVDNVLNAPTYFSRLMGQGIPFEGKTLSYTVDTANSSQFEWFTGLEDLGAQAEDTTVTLDYAHTAGTQPKVGIMLESFANAGSLGTIPLDAFQYAKAAQEAIRSVATAIYGLGTGDQPNGIRVIADDGTNASTIGGQSKSTYSALAGTYTDWANTITLAKLGTLDDNVSVGVGMNSTPNINVVDFTTWGLFEQLIDPTVVANYNATGFPMMPIRGDGMSSGGKLGANAGFIYLAHRGRPVIKDKFATATTWFKLNEDSFAWAGRSLVPDEFRGMVSKVNLGSMNGYDSHAAEEAPSQFNGWFYQKPQVLPNNAGTVARFYVIGQLCAWEPRLNGQGINASGI